jgi:hypothetical protein
MAEMLGDRPEGIEARNVCLDAEIEARRVYEAAKNKVPLDVPHLIATRDAYLKADEAAHKAVRAYAAELLDTPGVQKLLTSLGDTNNALKSEVNKLKETGENLQSFANALGVVAQIAISVVKFV